MKINSKKKVLFITMIIFLVMNKTDGLKKTMSINACLFN